MFVCLRSANFPGSGVSLRVSTCYSEGGTLHQEGRDPFLASGINRSSLGIASREWGLLGMGAIRDRNHSGATSLDTIYPHSGKRNSRLEELVLDRFGRFSANPEIELST